MTVLLRREGYSVYAPANPLRGIAPDAEYLRTFLAALTGPVILAGRSYRGAVITNAAAGNPNVRAPVYIAAYALGQGETIGAANALGGGSALLGEHIITRPLPGGGPNDVEAYVDPVYFREVFAHDLTASKASRWPRLSDRCRRPRSAHPRDSRAWQTIPSWYLVASRDHAIPPEAERAMAARARALTVEIASSDVCDDQPSAASDGSDHLGRGPTLTSTQDTTGANAMAPDLGADPPVDGSGPSLRLSDAGDAKPAWITLLTTEHYNLQTQRAATISESNGRASIFLGAVSAGLIALGFQGADSARSGGHTVFQVLVLSSLTFLGVVTFARCLEISIDDWQFAQRISKLRKAYAQLVPELAELMLVAAGPEQATAMLTPRRLPFQMMLSVAGSIGVVTSVLLGADAGVVIYGLHGSFAWAVGVGALIGLLAVIASGRFQRARWRGATTADSSLAAK